MAAASDQNEIATPRRRLMPRKRRWRALLLVLSLLGLAVIWAWMSREQIANNVIEAELERLGLPAQYDIVSIGPRQQILRNLVIGDAARPDLTIEEVVVNLDYGISGPVIGRIDLKKPRLFGSYTDGQFSLGALDPVLFAESDEPAGLPALDLGIEDARALIESDFGPIAAKLQGEGRLDDGFAGTLALTAPDIGTPDCNSEVATAYGDLSVTDGKPRFSGPVRMRGLQCKGGFARRFDATADLTLDREFDAADGTFMLAGESLAYDEFALGGLGGGIDFRWGRDGLNLRHDLTASAAQAAFGTAQMVSLDGAVRAGASFEALEWDLDLASNGMAVDRSGIVALSDLREASEGTLLAPLLQKFESNLAAAMSAADFAASARLRSDPDGIALAVPQAQLRSGSGDTLLAVSRLNWRDGPAGSTLRGNFITGGQGLPQINGRMEQTGRGELVLRMAMAEYAAGENRLAFPRMLVSQKSDGSITFAGGVTASGALPGGGVSGLEVPLVGAWSSRAGLALGRECETVRFQKLALYALELDARTLSLCPDEGGALVRYNDALAVSARTGELSLTGQLAGSPAELEAAGAVLRYPGPFAVEGLAATIGDSGNAVRLTASTLQGSFSDTIGGEFAGGSARLDIVPLDLGDLAGRWSYIDGALAINDATFILTDRIDGVKVKEARFKPLRAQSATLSLEGDAISALADLVHPLSGRRVATVDVAHNLGTSSGLANINVPGVVFDKALQPDQLTPIVNGVIELADGTVSGEGQVRWTPDGIDSNGTFATDGLDFAAAFGPVRDLSGAVEFTDLINFTTAPNQVIQIGAINPGIEVLAGELRFAISDATRIDLGGARWPFMGGELILRPLTIDYGTPGPQRYIFEMIGLDAATFVAQMELGNLGASGTFDGTVPIAFDDQGNGTIENGLLISRPPGGNVSYVGELTYEDLGAIGDFAFQSLRSLDYTQMSVGLSGNLSGEIITNFQFDGVRQGAGASRNFVTRQLAKLPIRFRVNVRSESFFELATIARLYIDPTTSRDPRSLGLFRTEDGRFVPADQLPQRNDDIPPDEPAIQPEAIQNRESEPEL